MNKNISHCSFNKLTQLKRSEDCFCHASLVDGRRKTLNAKGDKKVQSTLIAWKPLCHPLRSI